MQIRGGQFCETILASTLWYQNPCGASIYLYGRPNFRKKYENSIFSPKFDHFYGISLQKYQDILKNFTYGQTSYVMD